MLSAIYTEPQWKLESLIRVSLVALYDFGATTPTRKTVYSNYGYSWNGSTSSPTCTTAIGNGIVDRPCQVQMENGSGTQLRNSYTQYNTAGNVTGTAVLTGGSSYLTTSTSRYANGLPDVNTDPNGNHTTYTAGGCSISSVTPAISALVVSFTWDSGCEGDKVLSVTDPNGNSVSATYNDPFWRTTSTTDQLLNTVDFTYGQDPQTVETQMTFGSSDFDAFSTADALGRPLYAQQIETSGGSWDTTQMGYSWNSTGRVTTKTMPCATTKGAGCSTPTTTVTHDALGRPLVTTDGGGGTITNTYTGNSTCTSPLTGCYITTSTLGPAPTGEVVKEVAKEYNGLGQLLAACAISSASGSGACGFGGYAGFLTSYSYNADGTLAQSVRGAQTHSATYDAIGRVLTTTTPESGTTTYVYDTSSFCGTAWNGKLLYKADANGNITCYGYDTMGRLTSAPTAVGSPNYDGENKYFVYDSATVDGVVMSNTLGRLAEAYTAPSVGGTKVTDEGFSYDGRGQLTGYYQWSTNSGGWYVLGASYYANGVLETLTGASGGPWNYGLDGKGRPYSMGGGAGNSTNVVARTTYNANDQALIVSYAQGGTSASDQYQYDSTGRMTAYTFYTGTSSAYVNGNYTWNANGTLNGFSLQDSLNSQSIYCAYGTAWFSWGTSPAYDANGRLLNVRCNNGTVNVWGQNFAYDMYYNITKTIPSGYPGLTWSPGYSATNNQETGTTYDSNGNVKVDSFHTYTWNQDNHPLAFTDVPVTKILYDAFGRRVEQYNGSAYDQELYSPLGNLGVMTGQSVGLIKAPLPGGGIADSNGHYWHADHLGSMPLLTDMTGGASFSDRLYAPYGETYNTIGSSAYQNFTGDTQDVVAGIYDTPNRELNPNKGRWNSPDSGHASWNAYSYTTNPLGETDPSGSSAVNSMPSCGPDLCNAGLLGGDEFGGNINIDCSQGFCIDQFGDTDDAMGDISVAHAEGVPVYEAFILGGVDSFQPPYSSNFNISPSGLWGDDDDDSDRFTFYTQAAMQPPSYPFGNNSYRLPRMVDLLKSGPIVPQLPSVSQWNPPKSTDYITAPPGPFKPTVLNCVTAPNDTAEEILGNSVPIEHNPAATGLVYQSTSRGNNPTVSPETVEEANAFTVFFAGVLNMFGCLANAF